MKNDQAVLARQVPILQMKNITKTFPGVLTLDDVDFTAYSGKVNILVGENGAGKSTLMKILCGAYRMNAGEIHINNKKVSIEKPLDAKREGIAMIPQELNLVQDMGIAENIFLGFEPSKRGVIDKKLMLKHASALLQSIGLDINPKLPLGSLSTGQQQMVEIIKAISQGARIIVMDEPTSSLSGHEVSILFEMIEKLKHENVAIIYISHRLEEIFEIGDIITVLRDGIVVGAWQKRDMNRQLLIKQMVGREITQMFPKIEMDIGMPVMEVQNLSKQGLVNNVSFTVHAGEIMGFFGLVGAGRTELARCIIADIVPDEGSVLVDGEAVRIRNPRDSLKAGIGYVPEDRKFLGLNTEGSVKDNIAITLLDSISRFGVVDREQEKSICTRMIEKLRIKTPTPKQLLKNLSGGNQQKVVIAKWIAANIKVLIMDEPTRGVDVGAKVEIHKLMVDLAKNGMAVMMISSELPEILGMSDRVMIMHSGKIMGIVNREDATQELLMHYATDTISEFDGGR